MTSNMKSVLIRGLDRTLYQRFVAEAKKRGKTVGNLMNETIMHTSENGSSNSSDLVIDGSVTLSKYDILGVYREIGNFSIENSGLLTLEQNVDQEALKCMKTISNTGIMRVPKELQHLVLLKTRRICGTIEKY